MKVKLLCAVLLAAAISCEKLPEPEPEPGHEQEQTDPEPVHVDLPRAMVVSASVDGRRIPASGSLGEVSCTPVFELSYTRAIAVDEASLAAVSFSGGAVTASVSESDATVLILKPVEALKPSAKFSFKIAAGESFGVNLVEPYSFTFTTGYDRTDKFPRISDEELLTLVQRQTFKYFWDYGHPVSGLARERLGSGDTVTSGGSGFGIMTLPMAVERGFVSREEAAARLRTIVDFLTNKAKRHHGAYPHWINGSTGATLPFSTNDNGGDLVETAFLIQGLLAASGYFDRPEEADIREGIDAIWRDVEWDWYTRGGQDVLYWHWSPTADWTMNMKISGWNEALIVYVLAASSPTHPVPASAYHKGWARNGGIRNGKSFYGITLPLGSDLGGPLFFAHYSFMGLDPRGLKDKYADYWEQNVAHARINHAYCANSTASNGYSSSCWGLTASDIPGGYTASSPSNDKGVIAPTAALASMPYTPAESMDALHEFYYVYGDKLWGDYGFRDAFCPSSLWFASSYIAIDQGPIAVMIENYRTGLLWDCFMKHPDIPPGLATLGFEY